MDHEPQFRTATPRVVRVELADLYVGGNTAAVELDGHPCDAWAQALADSLVHDHTLAGVTAEVDGCWVHFTGVRKSAEPLAPRLLALVGAAGQRVYAPHMLRSIRHAAPNAAAAA